MDITISVVPSAAEEECASTYSGDEFELSLSGVSGVSDASDASGVSSVFRVGGDDDSVSRSCEIPKEAAMEGAAQTREGQQQEEPITAAGVAGQSDDGDRTPSIKDGDCADLSETAYSSFEDAPLAMISPSEVQERDNKTTKQKYLDIKRRTAAVCEEAEALAQRRYIEDSKIRVQEQQTKESWHKRIHRRHTEIEWHRKVSAKTAQSIIDVALNREAWIKGLLCQRSKQVAVDEAFSSVFGFFQARTSERRQAAAADERARAEQKAQACSNVWDAAKYGVPVQKLRELMDEKIRSSVSRHKSFNLSGPFEELCRRVEGVVVESRHPYPKRVRQDIEAHVPNATSFYVVFDAASNATMGAGKITMQEFNSSEPRVFYPRGPYSSSDNASKEARLPGVNGEPPMRVEGSSVLVTFSASYWTGVAKAGQDYGWRLVCFTASDDEAKALVAEAERAADRAEAVDAMNANGETCLHVASFEGNVAAARYLLSLDADPNRAHTAGGFNTPLHEAARSGSLAVTRLLLKSSANVLAVNSHGDRPLHVACREGRLDIARRLLAHDSDWATVTARNHAGLRPSEVVSGCWALASLLARLEVNAAKAVKAAKPLRASSGAINAHVNDAPSPAFLQQNNKNINVLGIRWEVALSGLPAAGARTLGGGHARGCRVKKGKKPGSGAGLSPKTPKRTLAMALPSGGVLPRRSRLVRPIREGRMHRQGCLLDERDGRHEREQQHRKHPRGSGEIGKIASGGTSAAYNNNVESITSEASEAQSVTSWSGTSYGASLTESDFAVPTPAEAVLAAGKPHGYGGGQT